MKSSIVPAGVTLAIFCRVVDNFGDIGICWRLARQFQREHGLAVTLWVDDLASFKRLHPAIDPDAACQQADGVTVRHWRDQEGRFTPAEVAQIVIEFFACDLPPGYIEAMGQCEPRPVWINYEGLSAEEWVEGCHTLPSTQRLKLVKHFFFPGYTGKTGGLLRERDLDARRAAFDRAAFLDRLGVPAEEQGRRLVSLFCYPHAPVSLLFDVWSEGAEPLTCLVPQGVAPDSIAAFLGGQPAATRGALTVRTVPFLPQDDYDQLLWSCDLNFVRGEDSWVRAQWAERPFIWHIYPQDENLHHKKLRAFLARYAGGAALDAFSLAWNGALAADWPALWSGLQASLGELKTHSAAWARAMAQNSDAAANLLRFAAVQRQFP